MTAKVYYDILELQQMELSELYNLALWFKVDTLNKPKQSIIYDILNSQQELKPKTDGKG